MYNIQTISMFTRKDQVWVGSICLCLKWNIAVNKWKLLCVVCVFPLQILVIAFVKLSTMKWHKDRGGLMTLKWNWSHENPAALIYQMAHPEREEEWQPTNHHHVCVFYMIKHMEGTLNHSFLTWQTCVIHHTCPYTTASSGK